uniref:DNA-directed RNA polymerase subunit beta'' n=1 Tax=Gloeotilopsis planctonica TaxID=34157 RepID=A0A1B2RZ68_9CHLO|nr:beta'' subunit of RNA polymerase [Gloeotilopsis planctonica]
MFNAFYFKNQNFFCRKPFQNTNCSYFFFALNSSSRSSSNSSSASLGKLSLSKSLHLKSVPHIPFHNFYNRSFDKSRLKTLISWSVFYFGEKKTIDLVEKLKLIGYGYATKAGISLSIDDLKIPISKKNYVSKAEQILILANQQVKKGRLTSMEYFSKVIETWNKTSENLKDEVITNFKKTDELNPVFLMAFSGARGNISQVRQLTSMRGLMSDPQGRIINFPIQSNFREGLTLTEYLISCHGARKGVVDTALRTATSGYLTRRLVDVAHHVIIRGFDCGTQKGILVTDFRKGSKTLIALKNRLVGRRLAEDVWNNKKELIGTRNQEIDSSLGLAISKIQNSVFVRSPLTCEKGNFVCQLCYGWSLASHRLVSLGEAVGIIAAQSIGEPGTQLTMRTFHTGGVFSGSISEEIKTPVAGVVTFPSSIPGKLVRTAYGQIAFLTKQESVLNVIPQNFDFLDNFSSKPAINPIQIQIPAYALVFAKQKQKVEKNQVLAESSTFLNEESYSIASYQTIYSEFSGQFKLEKPKNQIQIAKDKLDVEIDKLENFLTTEDFETLLFKEKAKIRKKIANFKKIRNNIFQSTQSGATQEFWIFAAQNQMIAKPVNLLIEPGDFVYSKAPIYLLQTSDFLSNSGEKRKQVFSPAAKKKSFLTFPFCVAEKQSYGLAKEESFQAKENFWNKEKVLPLRAQSTSVSKPFSRPSNFAGKKVLFFDFGKSCANKALKTQFFLTFTFFNEKSSLKKGKSFLMQKKKTVFKFKSESENFYPFGYFCCNKKTSFITQKFKLFFKAALQKEKSLVRNYPLVNLSFFNSNFLFTKLTHSSDFTKNHFLKTIEESKKNQKPKLCLAAKQNQSTSKNTKLFKQIGFSSLFKTKTAGFGIQDLFSITFVSSFKTTPLFLLFQFVSPTTNVSNLTPEQNFSFAVQNLNYYYFQTSFSLLKNKALVKKRTPFSKDFNKSIYTYLKKNWIKPYFKTSHLLKFYYFWNLPFFETTNFLVSPTQSLCGPSPIYFKGSRYGLGQKKTSLNNASKFFPNQRNLKKKIEIGNWKIQASFSKNSNEFQNQNSLKVKPHSLNISFFYKFFSQVDQKIFLTSFSLFLKPVLRSSLSSEHSFFTKNKNYLKSQTFVTKENFCPEDKKQLRRQSNFASENFSFTYFETKRNLQKQSFSNFELKSPNSKSKTWKSKASFLKDDSKLFKLSHPFFRKKNLLFLNKSFQKINKFSKPSSLKDFELEKVAVINTAFLMKQKKKRGKQEFLLPIFLKKILSPPTRFFWFSQKKKNTENLNFVNSFKNFNDFDLADFQKTLFFKSFFYEATFFFTKKYFPNLNLFFLIALKKNQLYTQLKTFSSKKFVSQAFSTSVQPSFFTLTKEKNRLSFNFKNKTQTFFRRKRKIFVATFLTSQKLLLPRVPKVFLPKLKTNLPKSFFGSKSYFVAQARLLPNELHRSPKILWPSKNLLTSFELKNENLPEDSFYFIKKSELFSALIEYQILRNLKKISSNTIFNKKPNLLKHFLILIFLLKKAYFLNYQSTKNNLLLEKVSFIDLNLQQFEKTLFNLSSKLKTFSFAPEDKFKKKFESFTEKVAFGTVGVHSLSDPTQNQANPQFFSELKANRNIKVDSKVAWSANLSVYPQCFVFSTEKNEKKQKKYSKSEILFQKKQIGFQTKNFSNFLNYETIKRKSENSYDAFQFFVEAQKQETNEIQTQIAQQASFLSFETNFSPSLSHLFFGKIRKTNPERFSFALFFKNKLNYYQYFACFPLAVQIQNRLFKNLKPLLFDSRFQSVILDSNFLKQQSSFNLKKLNWTNTSTFDALKNLEKTNSLNVNSVFKKDFFHFLFFSEILEKKKTKKKTNQKLSEKNLSVLYLAKKKAFSLNVCDFFKKVLPGSQKIDQTIILFPKIYFKYKFFAKTFVTKKKFENKCQSLLHRQGYFVAKNQNQNQKFQKKTWSNEKSSREKIYDLSKLLASNELFQTVSQINAVAKQHQHQPFTSFNPNSHTSFELEAASLKGKRAQSKFVKLQNSPFQKSFQQSFKLQQQKSQLFQFDELFTPAYENWVFPLIQPQVFIQKPNFFHIPGNLKLNDICFGNYSVLTDFFYSGFYKDFCEVHNSLNFWFKTIQSFKASNQKKINFSKKKFQSFFKRYLPSSQNPKVASQISYFKNSFDFCFSGKQSLAPQPNFNRNGKNWKPIKINKTLFLQTKLEQCQNLQDFERNFQSKKKKIFLNDVFYKKPYFTKKHCQNLFIIHPSLIWKKRFEKNIQNMLASDVSNVQKLNWIFKKKFVSFSNKTKFLFEKVNVLKAFLVFYSKSFQLFSGNFLFETFRKPRKKIRFFFKNSKTTYFFGTPTVLNFNEDFLKLPFQYLKTENCFEKKKLNKKTLNKYCRLYNFKIGQLPFFSISLSDFLANKKKQNWCDQTQTFYKVARYVLPQAQQKKQPKLTKQQIFAQRFNQARAPLLKEAAFLFNSNSRFQPKLLILEKKPPLELKANYLSNWSFLQDFSRGQVPGLTHYIFENKIQFNFLSSSTRLLVSTQKSTQYAEENLKKTKKESFSFLDKSNLLKKVSGNCSKTTLVNSKLSSTLPNFRIQAIAWKNVRNQKKLNFENQNWAIGPQLPESKKSFLIKFYDKKQKISSFFNFKIQPSLQVFWTFFNLIISKKKHREKFLISSIQKTELSHHHLYQAGEKQLSRKMRFSLLNSKLKTLKALNKTFLWEMQIFPFPFKVFWPQISIANLKKNLIKLTLNSIILAKRSKKNQNQNQTSTFHLYSNPELNFISGSKNQNLKANVLSCFKLFKQKEKFLYICQKKNSSLKLFSLNGNTKQKSFLVSLSSLFEINEKLFQKNLNFKQQNFCEREKQKQFGRKKKPKNLAQQEKNKRTQILGTLKNVSGKAKLKATLATNEICRENNVFANQKTSQIQSNFFFPQIKKAQKLDFSKQFKVFYSQQGLNIFQFHFDTTFLNQNSLDFLYNLQPLKKGLFQKNFKTTSLFLLETPIFYEQTQRLAGQVLKYPSEVKKVKKTESKNLAKKSFSTISSLNLNFDSCYVKKGLSFLKGEVFMAKRSSSFKFGDLALFKKSLPEMQVLTSDNLITFALGECLNHNKESDLIQKTDLTNFSSQKIKSLGANTKLAGLKKSKFSLSIGQILRYGQALSSSVGLKSSGQILLLQSDKMVLRYAKPFLLPRGARYDLASGDFIKKKSPLLTLKYTTLKTEDIVQGIPKIEQLFEARENIQEKLGVNALVKKKFHEFQKVYTFSISVRKSFEYIQKYIIDGIQSVYQSQGVNISDKHIEIIVKQMTSKVQIQKPYASGLLKGDIVYLTDIEKINLAIKAQNYVWSQKNLKIEQIIKKISFLKADQKKVLKIQTLEKNFHYLKKKLSSFQNKRVYSNTVLEILLKIKRRGRKIEKRISEKNRDFQKIQKLKTLQWELAALNQEKKNLEEQFQNHSQNKTLLESEILERNFRNQLTIQRREQKKLDRKLNLLKELEFGDIEKKNLEEKLQNLEKLKKIREIEALKSTLKSLIQIQKTTFQKFNRNQNYKFETLNFQILRKELEKQNLILREENRKGERQHSAEITWQIKTKDFKKKIKSLDTFSRKIFRKLGEENQLRDFDKVLQKLENQRVTLESYLEEYKTNHISPNYEFEQQIRQLRRNIKSKIRKLRPKIKNMRRELNFDSVVGSLLKHQNQQNLEPPFINQIEYEPVVLGITKASLTKAGFLSAASFQETIKILTKAPLFQQGDFLRGLKENVILGHLIPAGTGSDINVALSDLKVSSFVN